MIVQMYILQRIVIRTFLNSKPFFPGSLFYYFFQCLIQVHFEFHIGVLLILGLVTSLAATGLVAVMVVAFWTVHRSVGFWVTARPDEGWEYVLVLGTVGAAIAIGGPGEFSIDAAMGIEDLLNGWVGAALVAGGVMAAAAQVAIFFRPNEAAGT